MFRAQANNFDEVVAKATDENLTSENWALILDVCDRVTTSPQGPQSATAALIKRLAHRNANVQLYTLELANALSQNCGAPLHREIASRSFTDALLRLANDRSTHQQVKTKVLERMEGWTEMFRGDPDLGIMEQAFEKLRRGNPGLVAPSKPVKREIEDGDRKKEEDELQMALALSLREKAASPGASQTQGSGANQTQADGAPPPSQAGTTAATVSRVRALYDFTPSEAGELAFRKNDIIAVLESVYKDWWKGSLRGQTGIFPLNYVEKLQDPTREEMERDAEMEGEVFSQIRNVEKLLALLSVRGEGGMGQGRGDGSEEEITELYHQTLAIRPKLIELIGKYSQKKDDFTQLNEKFIKARRDYEALLESSMAQPPAGYGARQRHSSQPYYNSYGQPPQGYPPQQPYQQPPQQQDPQRFYNAQPSQAPPQGEYKYPPHVNGSSSPAPFHFIPPGGAPPPEARHHTPKPAHAPSSGMPPSEPAYTPQPQSQNFAARPQSIHTLNSGNPQELATGGYESPIDNRHSYPPAQALPPQQAYHPQAPLQQQQQQRLPVRQRTASFESPASAYSQDGAYPHMGQHPPPQGQGQPQGGPPPQGYPSQPQHAPPSIPQGQGNPYTAPLNSGPPPAGSYQAYNPQQQQQQQAPPVAGGAGGDDASDYYR